MTYYDVIFIIQLAVLVCYGCYLWVTKPTGRWIR